MPKLNIYSSSVCDYIDQVEHVSLLWRDFLEGTIDIEQVLGAIEAAGFDTAQDTPACFLWEEIFTARPNAKVIL